MTLLTHVKDRRSGLRRCCVLGRGEGADTSARHCFDGLERMANDRAALGAWIQSTATPSLNLVERILGCGPAEPNDGRNWSLAQAHPCAIPRTTTRLQLILLTSTKVRQNVARCWCLRELPSIRLVVQPATAHWARGVFAAPAGQEGERA